ncbi:hypothetical protein [Microbispora sp. NPDC049125]|uniref:Rv1733c family protein n=1 Tax=Microbispora sp. NPDC049125 TaxID=3154929 RepID=UPI0034667264
MRELGRRAMRCVRLYRPDGNPLRRVSDQVEAVALALVLVLSLLSLVPAIVVGNGVYRSGMAQQRSGRWVTATALRDVPKAAWVSADGVVTQLHTTVAWKSGSGRIATGEAPVPSHTRAGTAVRVWVDASGRPQARPPERTDTLVAAWVTGVATASGALLALLASFLLLRWRLDHRRYAAWDAEWVAVNPRKRKPEEA